MNLALLMIGIWFISFLICILFFACILKEEEIKGNGGVIIIISFFISIAITFLTGGIIG